MEQIADDLVDLVDHIQIGRVGLNLSYSHVFSLFFTFISIVIL